MDNMLELLKLYYAEWRFRQESLWKRIIQFFVIIFFTSTLPISIKIFDSSNEIKIPDNLLTLFPITGIFLTIFFLWFCLAESIRINTIDTKIKLIINSLFPSTYGKNGLVPLIRRSRDVLPIFKWRMAIWVPIFLSAIELLISIFMLLFFCHKI